MSRPRKILLTGASSGIGLAATHALTAAGHEVWGTARDVRRLLLPRRVVEWGQRLMYNLKN